MTNEPIHWADLEAKAANMSDAALWGAILDIQKTLPHADALDRETGSDTGGRYRDEASQYHKELADRRGGGMSREFDVIAESLAKGGA